MSTPAETPQIQRTDENSTLTERIWPVGVHIPVWLDNDCPSCGSAPCDPHPDTLACKECEDEWPCNIAANAAEELDRMAEFIGGNPGHVLRWRASALRGVIPGLAPVSSSEDTPARVWQDRDGDRWVDGPDDRMILIEHGGEVADYPGTTARSEVESVYGPLVVVPAGGEPA